MAPPCQSTPEQLKFVESYLADYLKYTLEKRQPTFWALLSEAWFSRWPELDVLISSGVLPPEAGESDGATPYTWPEEHTKLYQQAIKAWKTVSRVNFWYRNSLCS